MAQKTTRRINAALLQQSDAPSVDSPKSNRGDEYGLELWIANNVAHPIVTRLPSFIHPNHISMYNHAVCWLMLPTAYAAAAFSDSNPLVALLLRLLVVLEIFHACIMDMLDGMHARNTDQCSKLGEALDHSLDAANTICCGVSFMISMGLPIWAACLNSILTGAIYNGQLVVLKKTGRMINPPINGIEAQIIFCCGVHAVAAFAFFWFGFSSWIGWLITTGFTFGGTVSQIQNIWFYFRQGSFSACNGEHLYYWLQTMPLMVLVVQAHSSPFINSVIILVALRVTGSYSMFVVQQKSDPSNRLDSPTVIRHMLFVDMLVWAALLCLVPAQRDYELLAGLALAGWVYFWDTGDVFRCLPTFLKVDSQRNRK